MPETVTINKKEAMHAFFITYSNDIEGSVSLMNREQLIKYFTSDRFISCASVASGITEEEFVQYAPIYFGV